VIGGGPAGLSAGIALCQAGFHATVIDRSVPPIDKPCGEGLMPDSLEALAQLGVTIPTELGFRFRGIRFSGTDCSVCADFPNGDGVGVRRTLLHSLLLKRAQEVGVEMLWGAKQVDVAGVHVRVDGRVIPSQFTVAADGQTSLTRRLNGLNAVVREKRRYGFRRHYRVAPWSPYMELYWGRHCQVYVTPVTDDEICAVSMSCDSSVRLDAALAQFPTLRAHLERASVISREMGSLSISRKLRRVCRNGVALVGDASGSVDAITGEGLCLSFKQALSLAAALKSGNLAAYQAEHRAISRRPSWMASLMLTLDTHAGLQRRALASLANHPTVFAWLLSAHVSEMRFSDVLSLPLGQFVRTLLEV
jgi:flavin-dependent dehydrogenase